MESHIVIFSRFKILLLFLKCHFHAHQDLSLYSFSVIEFGYKININVKMCFLTFSNPMIHLIWRCTQTQYRHFKLLNVYLTDIKPRNKSALLPFKFLLFFILSFCFALPKCQVPSHCLML